MLFRLSQCGSNCFNPRAREGRDGSFISSPAPNSRCFNPRAREGRDTQLTLNFVLGFGVSIHAPVKGATILIRCFYTKLKSFNPRAREGRDITMDIEHALEILFQSTRP